MGVERGWGGRGGGGWEGVGGVRRGEESEQALGVRRGEELRSLFLKHCLFHIQVNTVD